jgi:Flp pilus assembly protein TadG
MNKRGSVALTSAVVLVLAIGFAGFAVDTTRIWLVKARLQTALDAASLVAAREISLSTRDTDTKTVFWVNFRQGGATGSYLGATIPDPVVTQLDSTHISVSATATVPTTIFGIISPSSVALSGSAVAQRAGTGLEVAIVLDQTSSMGQSASGTGYTTKLAAAQGATSSLLDVLYGSGNDTQPNLWISVVPFARTINIGTAHSSWLAGSGYPSGTGFTWGGCVEARRNGEDVTENNPSVAPFYPFFWASTYHSEGTVASGGCTQSSTTSYPDATGKNNKANMYCIGDNDWQTTGSVPSEISSYNPLYKYFKNNNVVPGYGPNILCALSSITPLTASKSAVLSAVNAITAPPASGGTTVAVGMQGAWYTLSPNWQTYWGIPNATTLPNAPAGGFPMPLDYGTANMQKAVVLLSDGDDNWNGSHDYTSYGVPSAGLPPSTYSNGKSTELFYNAYGRLADKRLTIPSTCTVTNKPILECNADAALDTQWMKVCTNMKANGILIYVIGFEVTTGSVQEGLLKSCATDANHYITAPTAANLQAAFTQVANQLASLALTQ